MTPGTVPTVTPLRNVHVAPLPSDAVAGIRALAGSLGFDCVNVDLEGCNDKAQFLDRVSRALEFPAWFGGNWDALFDCLADLGWRPAPGYVLVLGHASGLREAQPEVFDTALALMDDAASAWRERGIAFRVFVDASGR
jgi:RNAse (barnase) inhibitor barstar